MTNPWLSGLLQLVLACSTFGKSIISSGYVQFPEALPGKGPIKISKVYDAATRQASITSSIKEIQSAEDLVQFERKEEELFRRKHGSLSKGLIAKLNRLGKDERLPVVIALKTPYIQPLDKTMHGTARLKEQSQRWAALKPLADRADFKKKHGLVDLSVSEGVLKSEILISRLSPEQCGALAFDDAVASIEEYFNAYPVQGGTARTLGTLAVSAWRTSTGMQGSFGSGVNAATFESGLRQAFISCTGLNPVSWAAGSNNQVHIAHSEATFRLLAYTAPQANLYHHDAQLFSTDYARTFLVNNDIQTVSLSFSRPYTEPTYYEMRRIDEHAYFWPYTLFANPAGNPGTPNTSQWTGTAEWTCYNQINVGMVKHQNEANFVIDHVLGGVTVNPQDRYGGPCVMSNGGCVSDREMPYLVAPSVQPFAGVPMRENCLLNDWSTAIQDNYSGTSFAAPVANGIAADIISADSRMSAWPEKVRAVMLATAHNVENGEWSSNFDGRDGAGVMSGQDAVALAKNHTSVSENGAAAEHGVYAGSLYSAGFSQSPFLFNIKIPASKPPGKHLRVVLTWDSSPDIAQSASGNSLSDLDLHLTSNTTAKSSYSWNSNIEIIDVPSADLTANSTYQAEVHCYTDRIPPSGAAANFIYFAVAWTWVADHAM